MAYTNRLAGHVGSYHTYSLEEALEGIAAAGFRYVELSAVRGWNEHVLLESDARSLSKLQRMLNTLGLIPVSLSGHSDLTTKDGLELGRQALNLCDRMGIALMNTAIGGHYSEQEDETAFMANIGALADHAAERDVMIGLEVHGEITRSGAKAVAMIQRINRPNVRVNYDTANVEFYDNGTKAVDDLPIAVPYLISCHIKDHIGGAREWNFPAPGEGAVDFVRILRIMQAGGYTGPLSVEIEFTSAGFPALSEINRSMKSGHDYLVGLGLSS
jgi:sugar phosphate isomerase/epimerase